MGDIKITSKEEEFRSKAYKDKDVSVVEDHRILCTVCQADIKHVILLKEKLYEHPLLGVLICKHCYSFYTKGEFSADEDGVDKYCRWCGQGGQLFVCNDCPKAFCKKCIKTNLGRDFLLSVEKSSWKCVACLPEPIYKLRTLSWAVKKHLINMKKKNEIAKTKKSAVKKEKSSVKPSQTSSSNVLNMPILDVEKLNTFNEVVRIKGIEDAKKWLTNFSSELNEFWTQIGQSVSSCYLECQNIESIEEINMLCIGFGRTLEDTIGMLQSFDSKQKNYLSNWQRRMTNRNNQIIKNKSQSVKEQQSDSDSSVILVEDNENTIITIKDDDDDVIMNGTDSSPVVNAPKKAKRKNISPVRNTNDEYDNMANKTVETVSSTEKDNSMDLFVDKEDLTTSNYKIPSLEAKICDSEQNCNSDVDEEEAILEKSSVDNEHSLLQNKNCDEPVTSEQKNVSSVLVRDNDNSNCNPSTSTKEDSSSSSGTDPLDLHDSDMDTKRKKKKTPTSSKRDKTTNKSNLCSDDDVFQDRKERKKKSPKKSKFGKLFFSDKDSTSSEELPLRKKLVKKLKKKKKKSSKHKSKEQKLFSSSEDEIENIERFLKSSHALTYQIESGSEEMSSKSEVEEFENHNRSVEKEKELTILDCLSDTDLTPVEEVDDQYDYLKNGGFMQDWDLDNVQVFDETGSEQPTSETEEEVKRKKEKRKKGDSDDSASSDKKKGVHKKSRFVEDKLLKDEPDSDKEEKKWTKRIVMEKLNKKVSSDSDSDVFVSDSKSKKKKKIRRKERLLSSDSDNSTETSDEEKSSSSSTSEEVIPKKRKRIQKVSDSDSSGNEHSEKVTTSGGKGRKNIKKILKEDEIRKSTKTALKEEQERKKRIAEKQRMYNELIGKMPQESAELKELILDFDPKTKQALVSVHKDVVKKLKPHQAEGIKFMWDSCFESLEDTKKKKGSGCILAHCMGLGKTLQVVALLHTLFSHEETGINTVLILCPVSTVLNWSSEFRKWLDDVDSETNIEVYHLERTQNEYRCAMLKEWKRTGGVFIMGYNMIRALTSPGNKMKKKFKDAFNSALLDPGPDMVVCDEGHILKNQATAIAKTMTRMKTLRRIVLTGTPLQNNLIEYHCMVQFIKPDLLGTKKEFQNRFVNPIQNGQFEDSTSHDVKVMKRRAHVLHTMLDGIVQRKDYNVLTPYLPQKFEYVIHLKLSDVQCRLYKFYLEKLVDTTQTRRSLFADFLCLLRVCLHPRALLLKSEKDAIAKEKLDESDEEGSLKDFIDDGGSDSETSDSLAETSDSDDESTEKKTQPKKTTRSQGPAAAPEVLPEEITKNSEWWTDIVKEEEFDDIKQSPKMFLFFEILKHCEEIGDKLLVFSQSLYTLDIIEYFLQIATAQARSDKPSDEWTPYLSKWIRGVDYFRLDGTTNMDNRSKCCSNFNDDENLRARLFLISTKAGGLGINLTGANRVILFDACWNPSYDVQSIFRVYRFGQIKPCYIYRFLCKGTMEEKIYERQVAKLSTALRVIDEQQIDRHFTHSDLAELYKFNPEESGLRGIPILPKDRLMAELIQSFNNIILSYHQHDSLLQNQEDEELNEEERKAAWNDFENEKNPPPPTLNSNPLNNMYFLYDNIRQKLKLQNPAMPENLINQRALSVIQAYKDQQVASAIKYGNQPYSNNMAYNFGAGMSTFPVRNQLLQQQQQQQLLQQQQRQQQPQAQPRPGFSGIPNINIPF